MIKLTKKDLKTPDEIWIKSRTLMNWMTDQIVAILVGIGVLFFGLIIGVYVYQVRQKAEGTAQYHFSLAKNYFEEWKLQTAGEKQAKDNPETEANLKKELQLLSGDYKSSYANQMANQIRAELAAQDQKWPEAIQFYVAYEKALPSGDKDFARYPLAMAYEQTKDFTNALGVYESILKNDSKAEKNVYGALAMLGKARALRNLNRTPEARQVYEGFIDKHPDSPEIPMVRGLLGMTQEAAKETVKETPKK